MYEYPNALKRVKKGCQKHEKTIWSMRDKRERLLTF